MTRGGKLIPGRGQNVFECVLRVPERLRDRPGRRRRPGRTSRSSSAFFLLILFCNWVGLVPPVGKVELLRAPSSDVNITIGMALVSFLDLPRSRGSDTSASRGYLGKFFPVYEFKNGIGAGIIAMFVGLDRADARVRQAGHAVDATLRQHLRRRGRARRDHGAHDRASSRSRSSAWRSCSTRSRPSSSAS